MREQVLLSMTYAPQSVTPRSLPAVRSQRAAKPRNSTGGWLLLTVLDPQPVIPLPSVLVRVRLTRGKNGAGDARSSPQFRVCYPPRTCITSI